MKPVDFSLIEWVLSRLEDGFVPPLQLVSWRAFSLDLETRTTVRHQHETGGTSNQVGAGSRYGILSLAS